MTQLKTKPSLMPRNMQLLPLPIILAITLTACGGGSGSNTVSSSGGATTPTPTPAPTPTPTPTPTPAPTPTPTGSGTSFAPIDTSNRAQVDAAYLNSFLPLQATPFSWTGNVSNCTPGDTPLAYKNAEVQLLNFYRAMAGLPGNVTLSLPLSAKAQQGALMMDANNMLSHSPPTTWTCYTADGATAAGNSNLSISSGTLNGGIGGLGLYITDGGVSSLGHRRWVLYSQLAIVGTGDTPRANDLWVLGNAGPAYTPLNGTPWPPAGYVPLNSALFEPSMQWSFSYPNADFSSATVSMTDDAHNNVPLTGSGQLPNGYGDNTLAWNISSSATGWNRAPADTQLNVSVNNVMINGSARNFSYSVTLFTP